MADLLKIKSALISVYYKDNLESIVLNLNKLGVVIYSTGGTRAFIENLGVPVIPVETLTGFPSILGGRVKTLHPKIFGGILNRRNHLEDQQELATYAIPEIDLVIVDLYPFEETVKASADPAEIIEKIDIGGISLIRAAAKNFDHVTVISNKVQYQALNQILESQQGQIALSDRKKFAAFAFQTSAAYDSAIQEYLSGGTESKTLRYGENPHQQGRFQGKLSEVFDILNGKELSYNNILDLDAGLALMAEFDEPTCAILKHNNACGIASRATTLEAWNAALAGDPVSAFGGVLVFNTTLDAAAAKEIDRLFFEIISAPAFTDDALELLKKKANRIILLQKKFDWSTKTIRTALNGILIQDRDNSTEGKASMKPCTQLEPTSAQYTDLEFALKISKHTKSNTIVLAKNKQLCANGGGQTSRVDALKQAIEKAQAFHFDLNGAVMASDAFFPFPDCVEIAGKAGITAVVQPGGSIKDAASIDYCNQHNIAMVLTGIRHFKH